MAIERPGPRGGSDEAGAPRLGGAELAVGLALVALAAHLLVGGNYGYFRDELYYLAAGRHPAFGYVDFPPFIAVLAAATTSLLGDSLGALHLAPAVASALLVLVTGLTARELGGGRSAQGLAALAALASVTFLATGSIFSMDIWDELWWALGAYVLVRLLGRGQPRWWLAFGLVAAIGLLTKLTMLAFGFAVTVSLLLTPDRRQFRGRWPWWGGAIALAGLLPYLAWNAANGWPTPEFWAHYGSKLSGNTPWDFLSQQLLGMNPLTLPLTLAGLWYFGFDGEGRRYRALAWAFALLYLLFTLAHAKSYFLAPAYPMLFAGGARLAERAMARRGRRWLLLTYAALLGLSGLLFAPLVMPALPPDTYVRYFGPLPQVLADRFGWEELVDTVAGVYAALPPEDRARACIFTGNYGEAGAVDRLGRARGLPAAISGHNYYYLWGPDGCSGEVVITVGVPEADLTASAASVTQAGVVRCAYCMPMEDNDPVFVVRGPKAPVGERWSQAKHYD